MKRNLFEHIRCVLSLQLVRYGVIGLVQNGVGYGIYLFVTWLGVSPMLVVGISYLIAMLVSFIGNKTYTFDHKGSISGTGVRFIAAHACGYAINLGLLYVFVDCMGYAHQWVQLAAIFIVALFLFFTLKFFVFNTKPVEADYK